jgi:hypothetical protein
MQLRAPRSAALPRGLALTAGRQGPEDVAVALRAAVELALAGDWQQAHETAQRYEGDETAAWLHAVVHRIEGDLENARYWYRRSRRRLREEVSTVDELREIRLALAGPAK